MTTAEAQRQLEEANRNLDTAIECLVETPWRAREVHDELKELAAALKNVYEKRGHFRFGPPLVPVVRNIQSRMRQVQTLLDSAVTFYCGAISATLTQGGAYTADGQVARANDRGCLKFEA